MKRFFLLLSITFIVGINTNAQVRSYFGFLGGVSTPTGQFGAADYYNNTAGFAKKGVTFGIDGAVYFHKNWAIGATIAFNDQGELTNNDATALILGYDNDFKPTAITVTGVNRYHYISALFGPQYSFTKGAFILDLRPSFGFLSISSTPSLQIDVSGSQVLQNSSEIKQASVSKSVFGYGGTVGLRYKLSEKVCFVLHGNYINSNGPNIITSNPAQVTTNGHTVAVGRLVTKQPISVIQTTFGMTFGL